MGAQQPSVRQIGKYLVIDVIGAGGMGIVYRAQDPTIGRTVAIKMLRPREADAPGTFDRFFLREMKSTGNLHHKNIVTVYDSGEQDGSPYLVMEYLEGEPVSKVISERRALSLLDKLDVIIQVCDGLQYAHDRNIVHRDIKPANVILLSDGTAKLVDFGVARIAGSDTSLVATGQIVGSLSYMSPEQINSLPIDGRSDIFSTGVMLYEFLTFEVPFKGSDPSSTFVRILREEPLPLARFIPNAPPALQAVLSRAIAKSVHERYQSAEEFGFDLLGIQRDLKAATVADLLKRAEAAMQRGDLERGRTLLQDVIRLDRHNDHANRLLREVRQTIQQQQRSSQVGQIRSQAQVALAGGQFEEALACADQALRLDPTDTETIVLCEQIRNAISRAKSVRLALNRAEASLFAGDFDEAKEAVEEALRLDPSDGEARALASMINKELAERSRRARVQGFVDQARRGIAERKFTDALDALHCAEELDPTDSNVRELLQWAQRGQEQENRRKYLQEVTDQIEAALHGGDFSSACTISEMGLQRFPDEPTLLRLRSISEKQRDIADRRRFVHDQSLAVKTLTEQDKLLDAVQLLNEALRKYPSEPNLESLLAITRAAIDRQRMEREEAARKKAIQRAEEEARAQLTQKVLNWSIELRRALDGRASLADILKNSKELRTALESTQIDDHARDVASLVLNELRGRLRARDQAMVELEELQRAFERSVDTPGLNEIENRLLSAKTAFPNESSIQRIGSNLADGISRVREERDRSIALLGDLAQTVDTTPTSELTSLQENARKLAAAVATDPRVGALLQQIDSSISRRFERRADLLRDLAALHTSLTKVQSLDEITRICDRAAAIAALDSTDDELAERSRKLGIEGQILRESMESLLGEMAALARRVANATNIHDAEAVIFEVKDLTGKRPDFQNLQEAATRIFAEVQGRRIEHDLIVQELQAGLASVSLVETDDELVAAATRARECLEQHQSDPTILTLSREIVDKAEGILHQRTVSRARQVECDNALRISREKLLEQDLDGALEVLLRVEEQNPDRVDLHIQISFLRKSIEQREAERQAEQERLEQERRERQRAEEEARARQAAVEQAIQDAHESLSQGRGEEALECLRSALQREPENEELEAALHSTQAQITRHREQQERLERERIAREKAAAEARARKAAAEQAVTQAWEFLAQGRDHESVERLHSALQQDPGNADLRAALESVQAGIARRREEAERVERERIAREKAAAEAGARREAAELAIAEAGELLAQGRSNESVRRLRSALEQDSENSDLRKTLESTQAEIARQRAQQERMERERLEQERLERERIAREKAQAEAGARREAADLAIREAGELLAQGRNDESAQRLRTALQQDPQSSDLVRALDATQAEIARQREEQERIERERLEQERLERERIARENAQAEAHARREAADLAIREAGELLAQGRNDESVQRLRTALQQDPQSSDLVRALDATQAEIARQRAEQERLERERLEQERLERERIARERAQAEARARREAADLAIREAGELLAQGRNDESLQRLRTALQQDPQSSDLVKALDATQAEIARQRAEQERLARERARREQLERERAEALKAAAEQAIERARKLFAKGKSQESLECLRDALQRDRQNTEIQSAIQSIETELDRQRTERERLERERLERERMARENAEAAERARREAVEGAIREARQLLDEGREEESIRRLRSWVELYPKEAELRAALESIQKEAARQRAERERLERERLERERVAREKADAEARARQMAAERAIKEARRLLTVGRHEASILYVQTALEQDPDNSALRSELQSIQQEIARQRTESERLERERLERERIAREKTEAEARARQQAAELAIKQAQELLERGRNDESLQKLRGALQQDPQNPDLRKALDSTQAEIARQRAEQERLERERLERERLERERIAREKAEAEARARQQAAELAINQAQELLAQGRNDESLQKLRGALQQDPQNPDLRKALDSTQAEVARQRAEQERLERERLERERLERERIAREKADAETRARQQAAGLAIKQAQELLAQGRNDESLQKLRGALQQDPQNPDLRKALDSTQAELARQRAEQERLERERLERERLERERIAREKAEAEARARQQAAELAIKEAQNLHSQGRTEDAVQHLASAAERDPASAQMKTALQTMRAEVARQRAEKERLEREQRERERIAREKKEAEERARQAAAEQAIQKARKLLAKGSGTEAVQSLRSALERDPDNKELRSALKETQAEIDRQRAERERVERERVEKEQAALRARKAEIENALKQARKLQGDGKPDEALQHLRKALKRYPDSQELRSAVDAAQAEIKQRAEKQRAAQAEAKAKQAAQAKAAAPTKILPRATQPASEASAEARRRRMILIGILAGAAVLLTAIGIVVWRILSPSTIQVTFTLDPSDANLMIDGTKTVCHSPCPLSLPSKDHHVWAEQDGFTSPEKVAGPHSEKAFILHVPIPPPPPASASISIATDAVTAAQVVFDGTNKRDLTAQQQAGFDGLVAGPHHIAITEKDVTINLSLQVSLQGELSVADVRGPDQTPVVALTQVGDRQEIFCHCNGAGIQIDGKTVKHSRDNRYKVPGKATLHEVTLLRSGEQPHPIPLEGRDAKYGMVFIASVLPPPADPCQQKWEQIKESKNCTVLMPFRAQCSQGLYARFAYEECADVTWENTSKSTKADDYKTYFTNFPDTPHTQEAKDKYADLSQKEGEEAAWARTNKGDLNALAGFIGQYPKGTHFADAHLRMAELEWNNIETSSDQKVLQAFADRYKGTSYAQKALDRIRVITQPPPIAPCEADWNNLNQQDVSAIKAFIEKYQTDKCGELAHEQLEKLAQIQWDKISGSSQVADFENFVKDYPGTKHFAEANDRINTPKNHPDRDLILKVLDSYQSALNGKSPKKALEPIWPNPPKWLVDLISKADNIHVNLDKGEPIIDGESAKVPCTQTMQFRASGKSQSFTQPRLFRLGKDKGRWIILSDNN